MKNSNQLKQWIAYLQEELPPEEKAQMDQAIANDPNLALQIEGLRRLQQECDEGLSLEEFIAQKKNELRKN